MNRPRAKEIIFSKVARSCKKMSMGDKTLNPVAGAKKANLPIFGV
jgi:hypothetical protein